MLNRRQLAEVELLIILAFMTILGLLSTIVREVKYKVLNYKGRINEELLSQFVQIIILTDERFPLLLLVL